MDKELAAFKSIIGDFETYAKINLKIKTKKGEIVPLELNAPQKYIHEQLEKQLAETGKIRALVLKGRQQGASTLTEARFYWKTSTSFGKQAYILTHEQAATDNLFSMAKRYHDNGNPKLKPSVGASNAKELFFDKLDSGYKVGTAGSKAVGRSGTIQFIHGSEFGFWNNAEEHFAGVLQCVPTGAESIDTEVILESTANGIGGKFYDLWVEAINGLSEYNPIFVPWFWSEEYREVVHGFVPTKDELEKQKQYGVDNEQLAWRRGKEKELGKDLCNQEYPYCWLDAFLASGRPVFDKASVAKALLNCYKPKKRMILEKKQFVERVDGELKVWFEPIDGKKYVIGSDIAEGLEKGDYSCADVLEMPEGIQVAQWHGHIAPDKMAKVLFYLGMRYNTALIGVEANNHGILTNTTLRDMYYPYLYIQKTIDDGFSDSKEGKRIGWTTTSKSKPYIIDQLAAEIREGTSGIACKETIQECQTYIVEANGSTNAQKGCFDDRVMARAIAGEMMRYGRFN